MIKLRGIEFDEKELEDIYFNKNEKFLIKYKTVYLLRYNNNTSWYAMEVFKNYEKGTGYTRKGRFITCKAELVNKLLGKNIFHD